MEAAASRAQEISAMRNLVNKIQVAFLGQTHEAIAPILGYRDPRGYRKLLASYRTKMESPPLLSAERREEMTIVARVHRTFSFRTAIKWSLPAETLRHLLMKCRSYEEIRKDFLPLAERSVREYPKDGEVRHVWATGCWIIWVDQFDLGTASLAVGADIGRAWDEAAHLTECWTEARIYRYNARTVTVYTEYMKNENKPTPRVDWYEGYRDDAKEFNNFWMWRDTVEQAALCVQAGMLPPDQLDHCIEQTRESIEGKTFHSRYSLIQEVAIPYIEQVDGCEMVRQSRAYKSWKKAIEMKAKKKSKTRRV